MDQFKRFTAPKEYAFRITLLLSFLFIGALKGSDIYPGGGGREEAKSIQVTVHSLLGKSEYLRQIRELADTALPHHILQTGRIREQSDSAIEVYT